MLENLTERLSRIAKTIRGEARLTEANIQGALREVRMALLEADVGLPVVKTFIERVREAALGAEVVGSLTPGQALVGVVHSELTALMGGEDAALDLAVTPPAVVLLAGLQGSGKTTTAAKLAKKLVTEQKKKPLLVSCDVYRPAAIEQLRTLAAQIGVDFFPSEVGQKPVDITLAALDYAKKHYHDVLLVDTAGRLAIDEPMMREIAELHAALKPVETLFVVDSMQGQDSVKVAKAFGDALPLTGIVLTKLDGDARGGAALSVRQVTGKPIKFAGVSEKPDGLEQFHPERMASRILGMGDVLSLVEKARKTVDVDEAKKFAEKEKKGKGFDLEDFKQQIGQMRKMGGMASLIDKLPAQFAGGLQSPHMDEKHLRRVEGIICSMTPGERHSPEIINGSRRQRIARGSGTNVHDVNRLLKQYAQLRKVMRQFKGMEGKLPRSMKNLPGFPR